MDKTLFRGLDLIGLDESIQAGNKGKQLSHPVVIPTNHNNDHHGKISLNVQEGQLPLRGNQKLSNWASGCSKGGKLWLVLNGNQLYLDSNFMNLREEPIMSTFLHQFNF